MGSFLFATLYPWILNLVLNKSKSTRLTSHFAPKAASEPPTTIFFANTFLKIYTKNRTAKTQAKAPSTAGKFTLPFCLLISKAILFIRFNWVLSFIFVLSNSKYSLFVFSSILETIKPLIKSLSVGMKIFLYIFRLRDLFV